MKSFLSAILLLNLSTYMVQGYPAVVGNPKQVEDPAEQAEALDDPPSAQYLAKRKMLRNKPEPVAELRAVDNLPVENRADVIKKRLEAPRPNPLPQGNVMVQNEPAAQQIPRVNKTDKKQGGGADTVELENQLDSFYRRIANLRKQLKKPSNESEVRKLKKLPSVNVGVMPDTINDSKVKPIQQLDDVLLKPKEPRHPAPVAVNDTDEHEDLEEETEDQKPVLPPPADQPAPNAPAESVKPKAAQVDRPKIDDDVDRSARQKPDLEQTFRASKSKQLKNVILPQPSGDDDVPRRFLAKSPFKRPESERLKSRKDMGPVNGMPVELPKSNYDDIYFNVLSYKHITVILIMCLIVLTTICLRKPICACLMKCCCCCYSHPNTSRTQHTSGNGARKPAYQLLATDPSADAALKNYVY